MIFLIDRFEGKENLYFSLESYRVHSRRVIQGEGIGSRQKYGGLWVKSDSDRCDYEFFWCVYRGFIRVTFFEKKKKKKETKEKRLYSHRFFIMFPLIGRLYSNSKYSSRCKKQE